MNEIIREAMLENKYYSKAKNFRKAWESVDSLIDWNFHKSINAKLDCAWWELHKVVEIKESYNSYNACSCITFLSHEFEFEGKNIVALCFHLGGDVRGNYGELIFIDTTIQDLLYALYEITFEYSGYGISFDLYPFIGESHTIYSPYAYNRSESYNAKLESLNGYYYDKYPKGFVTAIEKFLP